MSSSRHSRSSARRPPQRPGGKRLLRAGTANARTVWPLHKRNQSAREAIEQLMRERGLARQFEIEIEREANRAARQPLKLEERIDLRQLVTFTVDPSTARDFDDAISAEQLADGDLRVWVHIADVSAYVAAGSPLDLEARRRATSVYVPGAVEPMLPHALSSGSCSLLPGVDRRAVSIELLVRNGEVIASSFHRSLIRSDMQLDYEHVDRIFAGTETAREPWGSSLLAARTASAALADRRERSGALVIDSKEPEFEFDEDGEVSAIYTRVQTESHRLIEHLMIAANEAVASHLAARGTAFLYRVHERAEPERVRALVGQLDSLGVPTPALPVPLEARQAEHLVGAISKLVDEHVRRSGHGRIALNSLVLRSLKQAYYSPANIGHAGLQAPCYCHFTSPIRRYPDLVCHRALLSTLGFAERPPSPRRLSDLGEWTSEREREAAKIEHEADDVAACFQLERILYEQGFDQRFLGEITGLAPGGVFIAFGIAGAERQEATFEGMISFRAMRTPEGHDDWWGLGEHATIVRGKRSGATLRLGQELAVRVLHVRSTRGQVDLEPAFKEL